MLTSINIDSSNCRQNRNDSDDVSRSGGQSNVFPGVFKLANPGPLGLFGFGLTTVLLNIHNAGFFPVDSMILGMGLVYGGGIQLLAGLLEFVRGNTFGFTAFCSYGGFWMSFVFLKIAPQYFAVHSPPAAFMAWYLFMWGIFSSCLLVATFKKTPALRVVFSTLVVLFMLLAIADWTGSDVILKIAGWEGIVCGFSAIYLGASEILHDAYGEKVLPY